MPKYISDSTVLILLPGSETSRTNKSRERSVAFGLMVTGIGRVSGTRTEWEMYVILFLRLASRPTYHLTCIIETAHTPFLP